jgi:hypothetical protein
MSARCITLFVAFYFFSEEVSVFHSAYPASNPILQEYILPDFSSNRFGKIRQPNDILPEGDQILTMNNERFSVPEIIFRPDIVGLLVLVAKMDPIISRF